MKGLKAKKMNNVHYISTNTGAYYRLSNIYRILDLIKSAGFTAYDFSMFNRGPEFVELSFIDGENYLELAQKLREYADKIGLVCNQAHSPFPSVCPEDEVKNIDRFEATKRSIEVAGILGAKIIIVHPFNDFTSEQNKEWYLKLLPLAEANKVKMAYENMWNWDHEKGHAIFAACASTEDFVKHIDDMNSNYVVACVDVGHASMMGDLVNPYDLIKGLNKRVQALHLHDNDLLHDNHQLPFTMNMDFAPIIKALKEINYQGDITLESDNYFVKNTVDEPSKIAKEMFIAAKKIYDEVFGN